MITAIAAGKASGRIAVVNLDITVTPDRRPLR
jgi:hypothetical protein